MWHGWTSREHADAYEQLLRTDVLPGIARVDGYAGAHLLRRDDGDEVEFVTMTWFTSLEAVRAFAGEDYTKAVIAPGAHGLLSHWDERSVHYELAFKV
jgi:heme-degrading monooxygenase HmoA